jgi:restriction system protein
VGNIASRTVMPRRLQIYHQVKGDARLHAVYQKVLELFVTWLTEEMKEFEQSGKKSLDPTKFLERANRECGLDGSAMALEFLIGHQEDSHKGFFNHFRQFDWQNVTDLSELFKSESLITPHGEFFDQRFVDYLAQNFSSLGSINWRKFEALTCEFFHRIGFHVEIGEGRDDEGVDARIWSDKADHASAPLILVQCKRQKAKVGKTVVKALYADVQAENAKLGLIVTSSALEPGARELCTARSYPVAESNRKNLKKWIEAMRTPRAGLFFGE